jgi:glucose dehydrogenase
MTAAPEVIAAAPMGKLWTASGFPDPGDNFGHDDPPSTASGHVTSIDADSGRVVWKFDSKTPLVGAVTPTAGGLVFFGDLNGKLWALEARTGKPLWSDTLGGAIGGGLISYDTGRGQRVAVATGMSSRMWPGTGAHAAVVVLGLQKTRLRR